MRLVSLLSTRPEIDRGPTVSRATDSDTFADATKLPSSHDAALKAASGIASAGLRVLISEEFRKEMRDAWEADVGEDEEVKAAVRKIDELLPDPRRTEPR